MYREELINVNVAVPFKKFRVEKLRLIIYFALVRYNIDHVIPERILVHNDTTKIHALNIGM